MRTLAINEQQGTKTSKTSKRPMELKKATLVKDDHDYTRALWRFTSDFSVVVTKRLNLNHQSVLDQYETHRDYQHNLPAEKCCARDTLLTLIEGEY